MNAKDFPKDLAALQVYARISNPWDLAKVKLGEVDKKTGDLKRQKALFVSILLGTRYTLEHVLEIAYPSLSAIGSQVRKKDVDALESRAERLPPPSSGSTGPSPSVKEGSRGPVQGE